MFVDTAVEQDVDVAPGFKQFTGITLTEVVGAANRWNRRRASGRNGGNGDKFGHIVMGRPRGCSY